MTYEQTREQFLLALNSNAYLNMCTCDDMKNAINALDTAFKIEKITIDMEHKLEFYVKMAHECEDGYYQDKFYVMADVLGECLGKLKRL